MICLLAMGNGLDSIVSSLEIRLLHRWGPKWFEAFRDPALGGYYERLNRNFKPVLTGQRRLVSHCRQLALYADLYVRSKPYGFNGLQSDFDVIVRRFHDAKSGHWWFSVDDDGAVKDRYSDLYALGFVIFACAHYGRAGGGEVARVTARQVLDFIHENFRVSGLPGLAEAIGEDGKPLPRIRRQNPHMHLLEACLFAHQAWPQESGFLRMADEMVSLFQDYFYDAAHGVVREFFTDDLQIHPQEGHKIEPGHGFEWIWLLKKHAAAHDDAARHDGVCQKLLDAANRYGWDNSVGGIFDVVGPDGRGLADTKRIWPFCEALKANVLMLRTVNDRQGLKDHIAAMVKVFREGYIDERGFWTEWLHRDLSPATDYMPATTPYHVYFGITETRDVLRRRGRTKSITARVGGQAYRYRRFFSKTVKQIRAAWR